MSLSLCPRWRNKMYLFIYKQTDGLVMGLPLGTTIANIFMYLKEKISFNNCPVNFRPAFPQRNVKHFPIVETFLSCSRILDSLNVQPKDIKFKQEEESQGKVHFLIALLTAKIENFLS